MLSNAYRLRKKCAVNGHFVEKTRESDRYNYFTSDRMRRTEKAPKTGLFTVFVSRKDRSRRGMVPRGGTKNAALVKFGFAAWHLLLPTVPEYPL